jgi:alkanesulfonate monooxygenase SsuD/methylene tetrahydromethanopterin reductase-like flavin-dependent oxidoreductase (luciferase family)
LASLSDTAGRQRPSPRGRGRSAGPRPTGGSPQTVADILQRWFSERALDGASIHIGHPAQFRRFLDEVVPILRERGIVRAECEADTLRGNLGIPVPENRHTWGRWTADRSWR